MPDQTQQQSWRTWIEAFRFAVSGQGILFLVFTAGCVGIFYTKALLSIFSGVLIGVASLNLVFNRRAWNTIIEYKGLTALMCVVFVYLLSGIQSDDMQRWARLTWENIPYATLPIGFFIYRNVPAATWKRLLVIFVGITALSACSVMLDYILHFTEYNALYKIGQTIPMPVIHVRYSFFVALAACLSLALAYEWPRNDRLHAGLFVSTGVFLAIVVHVLAVRTGILAFYGGLAVMMACMVVRDRKWKLGLAVGVSMILLAVMAWKTMPSIANKIGYVLYDLRMMKEQGALAEYSDNVRITSIRHGLALLSDNMITGTGIGDLRDEMSEMYARKTPGFPAESRFPPISQYFFILTAFGIAGASLYFFLLLYPLWNTPFSYLMVAIYGATFFSMIGETTIELLLGKTVFVSLVCIGILHAHSSRPVTAGSVIAMY